MKFSSLFVRDLALVARLARLATRKQCVKRGVLTRLASMAMQLPSAEPVRSDARAADFLLSAVLSVTIFTRFGTQWFAIQRSPFVYSPSMFALPECGQGRFAYRTSALLSVLLVQKKRRLILLSLMNLEKNNTQDGQMHGVIERGPRFAVYDLYIIQYHT